LLAMRRSPYTEISRCMRCTSALLLKAAVQKAAF
jgi:hypothetical protein